MEKWKRNKPTIMRSKSSVMRSWLPMKDTSSREGTKVSDKGHKLLFVLSQRKERKRKKKIHEMTSIHHLIELKKVINDELLKLVEHRFSLVFPVQLVQ